MSALLDALHAIPFAVWCAIVLLAVAVGIAGELIAAAFRDDDSEARR